MDPPGPLVVVEATAAEKRARDAICHEAWGEPLSVAQFVAREERLRATPFARRTMRTWLLVRPGERAALSSLETFEVASRHGLRPGRSFEIASVFTERSLRGRGYATRLLDEVAAQLGRLPRAQALTLYSDVGAPIYERAGFRARPAFDWFVPAAREATPGVWRSDSPRAVAAVLAAHPPRGRYAILPDADQIDWHRERERIYAEVLGAPPVAHGVLACAGGHALVAAGHKHTRLVVLAFVARDASSAAQLLAACADEAARAGLAEVLLWAAPDPRDDQPLAEAVAARGGRAAPRDGALPMLRSLPAAPSLTAEAWREIPRALWV